MDDRLENIRAQMADVEETLLLLRKALERPDKGQIEWMAVAGFTCNVYMGVENILKNALRAKGVKAFPDSPSSHRDLLDLAGEGGVLSQELRQTLDGYRSLRHVIYHGYGFRLDSDRVGHLASALSGVWAQFRDHMANVFPQLRNPES